MNTAPKLPLSVRFATALVAVVATFAVTHGLDSMSARYMQQTAASIAAANTHSTMQHA
jgi:hypothetical protein